MHPQYGRTSTSGWALDQFGGEARLIGSYEQPLRMSINVSTYVALIQLYLSRDVTVKPAS